MAEKILNTRIINKHASLAEWGSSTLVLKAGEIALAYVETTKPDGHGGSYTVPTYLMKIGDGTSTFANLNWLAAPASDVYAWAKKANLDLSDIPTMDAAHIPTLAIDKIDGLGTKLANLEAAVGTGGSVDTKITNAINALDVDASTDSDGVVIQSISETDGKISVTRRALAATDIPNLAISKITGLQDALDAKATPADITSAVNAEKTARESADADLTKSINDLKTAIGNLSNIMNFRGAVTAKTEITDPVEGDVIVVTAGEDNGKEFVYSNGAWVEFGSVSAQDAAISALQERATALEGRMDTAESKLNTIQGTGEGSIAKALADAKSYADQSEADAISAVQGSDSDDSGAATVAGAKKYTDEKVKALADGQVKTNKEDITSLKTRVSNIEADYLKAADTYVFDCGGATE